MYALRIAIPLTALLVLAGCASGVAAPTESTPIVRAPVQDAPVPQQTPEGRVIKVIQLPKGQTPYDLPPEQVVPERRPVSCRPPAPKPVYQPVCGDGASGLFTCGVLTACDVDPCAGGKCSIPR